MPTVKELGPQLTKLLTELDARAAKCRRTRRYLDGSSPIPDAIQTAGLTTAYNALMGMSQAPWASLVVDSVQDRLEVGGIRSGDDDIDEAIWGIWQANAMDSESKLGHHGALSDGRVFATIWPDANGEPEIILEGADVVVIQYREGRHQPRHRVAALRAWVEDDTRHLTLYRADALFKFTEAREQNDGENRVQVCGRWYEPRIELGRDGLDEPWPLPNPYGIVPNVELATNRRLQPGAFPYARGEFEHCTGLIDRINLLTFLGLVVALWMGFPLRYLIGDKILRDDDNNPIAPFDSKPDEIVQLENHEAKIGQLEPADRKNLSIFAELAQLAYVTKTPAHYFPIDGSMSNISADMVRALEGGLHAKVDGIHKPFLGEGHEEVLRTAGLMLSKPVQLPRTAEVLWLDKQSRSIAEAADAATKLKELLPWQMIAEEYLGYTQEMIRRAEALGAGSALTDLLKAAANGGGAPAPAPAG